MDKDDLEDLQRDYKMRTKGSMMIMRI